MTIQKSFILLQIQDLDQSRFFLGTIDHEVMQACTKTHHPNSLCDKLIMLKTI